MKQYREFYNVYEERPIKPIEGTTKIGIRDIFVEEALRLKLKMRVFTTKGIAIEDPKDWIRRAGKKEPWVGLYEDNPMQLYYAWAKIVPIKEPTQEDKLKEIALSTM